MQILLTGASGIVGQAALAACRQHARVVQVHAVVRRPLGISGEKVREVVCPNLFQVSGASTISTGTGRTMWARVKGATENTLTKLGFAGVALFRPGYIQPLHGVRSKVGWYNAVYAILKPFYPLVKKVTARYITDTDTLGRAMLAAVQPGMATAIYESIGINRLGALASNNWSLHVR